MSKYSKIFESIQEKVDNGTFSVTEAKALNDIAFSKYGNESDFNAYEALEDIEKTISDKDFMESPEFTEAYNEYETIVEGIQEKYENGEITFEEAKEFNDLAYEKYVTESFTESPLKKMVNKLKKIKDEKPNEFDGPEDVKKFVDKNFDDIKKASDLLQEEPDKLEKDDKMYLLSTCVSFIGYMASIAAIEIVGPALLIASGIWMIVSQVAWVFIRASRAHADVESMKSLSKIKTALKKLDTKKLPKEYQKKVSTLIQNIDDAETDVYSKLKKVSD